METDPIDNDTALFTQGSSRLWMLTAVLVIAPLIMMYFIWVDPQDWLMSTYLQLPTGVIFFLAVYFLLLLVMWPLMLLVGSLYVYPDRVVRAPRFRPAQVFYFRDLIGWEQNIDHEDGHIIDVRMYFREGDGERMIIFGALTQVRELSAFLTDRGYPIYHSQADRGSRMKVAIGALSFMLLYVVFWFVLGHYGPVIRDQHKGTETMKLSRLVTASVPGEYRQKYEHEHYVFRTEQYTDIVFFTCNDSVRIPTIPESYSREHDTITITILQYDYDVKIAHTRQPTFWDRHFDYGFVHLESLHFDQLHETDFSITTDRDWRR